MDGKRQHQRICEGASHGGSVGARTFLVYGPHLRPLLTITRLLQLGDVTKGLIYMHGEGVVRGDLKGVRFRTP